MRVGDVANEDAAKYGKPLDGVRVLALEQMQALPYATQLLARLGADVVKIEAPTGESGRGSQPGMHDPQGRFIGATFLRNNLSKKSVTVDLKKDAGRELVLSLAPHFDVLAENFKSGALDRMGLGYDDVVKVAPERDLRVAVGLRRQRFALHRLACVRVDRGVDVGHLRLRARRRRDPAAQPRRARSGDISSGLFATIGILAALRHRDRTGEGQRIDIAMYDATVAMTDIVTNFGSMGKFRLNEPRNAILDPFRASDGWFVMQLVREHQLERISQLVGHPEWPTDPRLATREGWAAHLEDMLRPAIEKWASHMTKLEAVQQLSAAGIAAAPVQTAQEVLADPHLDQRNMLVEMDRSDGVEAPVVIPGNPVKLSKMAEGPESRVPWLGEHTRSVLHDELGLDDSAIDQLVADGVVTD